MSSGLGPPSAPGPQAGTCNGGHQTTINQQHVQFTRTHISIANENLGQAQLTVCDTEGTQRRCCGCRGSLRDFAHEVCESRQPPGRVLSVGAFESEPGAELGSLLQSMHTRW